MRIENGAILPTPKGDRLRHKSRGKKSKKKEASEVVYKLSPDRAWFEQRLKLLQLTQKHVGELIGIRKEGLGRVLAGTRDLSAGEAVALSKALRCSVMELLSRMGLETQRGLELSGRVLPDGRVSSVIDAAAGVAAVSGDYPPEAVALLIEAPEGPLAPYDGAVLVYRPSTARTVGPDAVGRLCVIEDAAAPLPVVGELLAATGSRENRVRVFGTSEEVPAKRLLKAHPVIAIVLRS